MLLRVCVLIYFLGISKVLYFQLNGGKTYSRSNMTASPVTKYFSLSQQVLPPNGFAMLKWSSLKDCFEGCLCKFSGIQVMVIQVVESYQLD